MNNEILLVVTDNTSKVKLQLKKYLKESNLNILEETSHTIIVNDNKKYVIININNLDVAKGYKPSRIVIDKFLKINDYYNIIKPFLEKQNCGDIETVMI